jgi:HlyD family secretion protein
LAEVTRGTIVTVVNSTGEVKPVLSIQVGSFVSGPIDKIHVDFNDEVKKGELLAEIDPVLFQANVARDEAVLATAEAEVERAKALLKQADNECKRALALRDENEDYISDSELDQYRFNRASLEASVAVAEASVQQAQASLAHSRRNLGYTKITAPDDGIIIDRKIDPGQTLAAQFQTPEMFILAPRMREKMYVFASVDEADIGLVKTAKEDRQPAHFTVDAYPEELFLGVIEQIRMSSTMTQNVVTYPVVVAAANPDLKLLPGMTASISFQIEEKSDIVKIPNAALRFYPEPKMVRPQDLTVLEGAARDSSEQDDSEASRPSAVQKTEAQQKRHRRHVWVVEGDQLKAVEVVTGLSDNQSTELVAGDIEVGQKLVTGVKPKRDVYSSK